MSSGWLGPDTVLGHADDRKIGRAMVTSLAIHGGLLALVITAFTVVPAQVMTQTDPLEYKVVFLPEVGPGGGGGGSPAPAPPKPVEIPKHKAPVTMPVEVPTPAIPPPIPTLVAPIETTAASVIQSSGTEHGVARAVWRRRPRRRCRLRHGQRRWSRRLVAGSAAEPTSRATG